MKVSQSLTNLKGKRSINPSLLSFPHIFVYEASAGSGKTRRLASRYIDFLLHYSGKTTVPFDFRNLLAVTFTNEAADQMKQEILRMLKTKAFREDKDSHIAIQITEEIIRNFSDFAVRTIDSFVHSLLVASSLELKLPADYEIIHQSLPYLEYVLDNFLEEILYDSEAKQLFLVFLNHFLVVERQRYWNPKRALLNLLDKFYREENGRARRFLEILGDFDLSQRENELKIQIEQFISSLATHSGLNQRFLNGIHSLLSSSGLYFLNDINRYINKSLTPGRGILNKNSSEPDLGLVQAWEKLKKQYDSYLHNFVWLRHSSYLKIFNKFRQRLEDFKESKRIVFLEELNRKARQFLTSEGLLPTEIYYKLAAVLYHYLIDEFQDTSILQWENIQPLVEDALSKGGSLFYVGDKKQAIYRFRGGEVELFDSIKQHFRDKVARIYDEVLLYNYRSKKIVVEFNNLTFSKQNLTNFLETFPYLTREFKKKILSVFKDSKQKHSSLDPQAGYVRLEIVGGENKQQLQKNIDAKIKEILFQLEARFNYRDILILVRDNREAESVTNFLLKDGYPVCASRTISIRHNFLIRQITALLKFLNSPIDNLCFVNFILGDVFIKATGLSVDSLRSWLEGIRLDGKGDVLYTEFRLIFPDLWQEFLQYIFNATGFLPVYDLVQTILLKFNIEINFPHLTAFTQRLLEILNDLQEQGKNSLPDFLEWFDNIEEEELFVQLPLGLDAIRVLTIHKAKGLTWPVVILPYAGLEVKIGEASRIVHETEDGLYLLYIQKDLYQNHPELKPIYQREYFQAILDELNCLYVGFTRAASELYIFIPEKINRRANPLITLLFNHEPDSKLKEFGNKGEYLSKRKAPIGESRQIIEQKRYLPQEAIKNILKDQLIQPIQIISSEKRNLINRGQLLHYLMMDLDYINFLKNSNSFVQNIKDACRKFSYPFTEEIISYLLDFFKDPKMQEFFNPQLRASSEQEIVDRNGNLRRIDRLVFTKDKILVIDFKTGEGFKTEHQQQIREYVDLLRKIYPGRLLEGWLIYVDERKAKMVST